VIPPQLSAGLGLRQGQGTPSEIERVFAEMGQHRPDAVLVSGEGDLYAHRQLIAELTQKYRLPAMCPYRDYVDAGGSAARRQIGPGGLCQPLAAHGGAEADEAQRARHGDGNPARPERHIDAIQGDRPPHHNPDQLQKRDQGKDGGGKRAKGSYGHCASPMAHEDVLVPRSQNGEGPARRPLPLSREVA